MNIVIASRQQARKIDPRLLKKIAEVLLADLEIGEAELGINLVAAREMTMINETFLRHKGSTDVITFDYGFGVPPSGGAVLKMRNRLKPELQALHGEIFICVDEAVSQSKEFKTTWQSEIGRYLVHGVLHLLGHDDLWPAARRKMQREENRRLRALSRRFSLAQLGRPVKLST
jgi:probable rRNA maturation factor